MNSENTNPAQGPGVLTFAPQGSDIAACGFAFAACGLAPSPTLDARRSINEVGLLPVGTLVLWMFCIVVGVLGFIIPYPAHIAPAPSPPVQAEIMHVDLTKMISPAAFARPAAPNHSAPPEENSVPAPPEIPAAVAAPSPAIAFAVPVAGPARIVSANKAVATPIARPQTHTAPARSGAPAQPTHLVLGQGEGRQPAPQYPPEAVRQGEQGTVAVRFSVSETGAVLTADAFVPCAYPLLNEAALRAIRDTWHFTSGAARSYEVSIQFQLQPR